MNSTGLRNMRSVKFLAESPSDEDLFDGKAHERVAEAIASVVEDEGVQSGKIIGLEGSWGSGKSTIVGLISKKLDPMTTATIMFDSWAHQEDPLRRAFLETVINRLKELNLLDEVVATDFGLQLSGKSTEVHTESSAYLSKEGLTISLVSLLVPLGALLSSTHTRTYEGFYRALGGVLIAAPPIAICGFFIARGVGRILEGKKGKNAFSRMAKIEPFSFFAKNQKVNTRSVGIEHTEPTSLEFEKIFKDIVEKSKLESRQLLVILDNLDRVDAVSARHLLATMQTFIQVSRASQSAKSSNIWLLIPYDPAGLDELWNAGEVNGIPESPDTSVPPITSPTSVAFVEKIFNLRFEAPPLVISDWHKHLRILLAQALPESDQGDFDAILKLRVRYQQLQVRGVVARESPTPRQLKNFVNQIGVLCRLTSSIPLPQIAYYVLLRQDRINVAEMLLGSPQRNSRLERSLGEDLERNLAALHFGTEPELAQQLLFARALDESFEQESTEGISQLMQLRGFVEVIDNLDVERMMGNGGTDLIRNIGVLDSARVFEIPELANWLAKDVCRLAVKMPTWSPQGRCSGVGLAKLFLNMLPYGLSLRDLMERISAVPQDPDAENYLEYLEGVTGLLDSLVQEKALTQNISMRIRFPGSSLVQSLSILLDLLVERDSWRCLVIENTPEEISNSLIEAALMDRPEIVGRSLRYLLEIGNLIDLPLLASGIAQALDSRRASSQPQLTSIESLIEQVSGSTTPDEFLRPLASTGALMHLVSVASGNDLFDLLANVSMLHLSVIPSFADTNRCGDSQNGRQVLGQILQYPLNHVAIISEQAKWLKVHSETAFYLLMSVRPHFPGWFSNVLHELANTSGLLVKAEQYLSHLEILRSEFTSSELDTIGRALFINESSRAQIIASSMDLELILSAMRIAQTDMEIAADVRKWGKAAILNTSEQDWVKALGNPQGDSLLTLAILLADTEDAPSNPPGLAPALHVHFRSVIENVPAWLPSSEIFAKVTSLLPAASRRVIAAEFCAKLEPLDGVVRPEFFETYGKFLGSEKMFRIHPLLPHFIERAVSREQLGTLGWIVDLANSHSDVFEAKGRPDGMTHLRSTVEARLSDYASRQELPPEILTTLGKMLEL